MQLAPSLEMCSQSSLRSCSSRAGIRTPTWEILQVQIFSRPFVHEDVMSYVIRGKSDLNHAHTMTNRSVSSRPNMSDSLFMNWQFTFSTFKFLYVQYEIIYGEKLCMFRYAPTIAQLRKDNGEKIECITFYRCWISFPVENSFSISFENRSRRCLQHTRAVLSQTVYSPPTSSESRAIRAIDCVSQTSKEPIHPVVLLLVSKTHLSPSPTSTSHAQIAQNLAVPMRIAISFLSSDYRVT